MDASTNIPPLFLIPKKVPLSLVISDRKCLVSSNVYVMLLYVSRLEFGVLSSGFGPSGVTFRVAPGVSPGVLF